MLFKMNKFGKRLATREEGRIVHEVIWDLISNNSERIIIDFEDVVLVTNSFADEFIGKLVLELGVEVLKKKTTFKNVDKFVSIILSKAINNRIKELVA